MSTPTWVRIPPNRRIFATRKSMLLRRSANTVYGAIRFTVATAAPVRGRPSGCGPGAVHALSATKFASRYPPGALIPVAATWTATRGIVYAARPATSGRCGSAKRQEGYVTERGTPRDG